MGGLTSDSESLWEDLSSLSSKGSLTGELSSKLGLIFFLPLGDWLSLLTITHLGREKKNNPGLPTLPVSTLYW